MNAVLSPRTMAISMAEWADQSTRDEFQERLEDYLETVEALRTTRVYVSDEMLAYLWSSSLAPWRTDTVMFNQIAPVLYKRIARIQIPISTTATSCACTPVPSCACTTSDGPLDSGFMRLVHSVAVIETAFSVLGTPADTPTRVSMIRFICKHHGIVADCPIFHNLAEYARSLDLASLCWPTGADEDSRERLLTGMKLYSRAHLPLTGSEPRVWPILTPQFLEDLATQTAYRDKVMHALTLRAKLSQPAAVASTELQDEKVKRLRGPRAGERRFRATVELRVHYHLIGDCIKYERFYGPGEHDDGLS